MTQAMATLPDSVRLDQFMGKMLGDMGAAASLALVILGDKLGLYRDLAALGSATSEELSDKAGASERYVREWLSAQAAAGYVDYDPATSRFSLNPEQQAVFVREGEPTFMAGGMEVVGALYRDEPKVTEAFRSGGGVGWHEHDACLFRGTERFFRAGYNAHLVQAWLPALDGVVAKLERGALVADIGCGHGASAIIMAKAFPNSRFHGFDYHAPSIERARRLAEEEGADANTSFAVADAKGFPGEAYDLVCIFDALHDMGDPVGAARRIREALKPDGSWMLVEPFAGDRLEDNLNPVGRIFYAASTMICTPASMSQEVGLALGAQAGEARLRKVCEDAGFTRFRRATETPFNLVFEVRP